MSSVPAQDHRCRTRCFRGWGHQHPLGTQVTLHHNHTAQHRTTQPGCRSHLRQKKVLRKKKTKNTFLLFSVIIFWLGLRGQPLTSLHCLGLNREGSEQLSGAKPHGRCISRGKASSPLCLCSKEPDVLPDTLALG